ncbi:MAG: hypothetical protein QGI24_07595 [Kiritimatiellia bacterium]|nr:hypothetical protein [Kiritimatiellia bacterium]MDP6848635.1 hypothetical protein [Kiritimatiellia bacterium]
MRKWQSRMASAMVAFGIALSNASAEIVLEVPEPAGPAAPSISVPAPSGGGDAPAAAGASDGKSSDLLQFVNKDGVHGSLVSYSEAKYGLKWRHEHVKDPILFSLANVSKIKLAGRRVVADTTGASVILTNDDVLMGRIVSLDSEKLVFDTWYAGRMSIEKVMIKAIHPNTKGSTAIFEGPSDLASWTVQNHGNLQAWKFRDNALYALQAYPIGKIIEKMPDSVDIEFEIAWRGYPQFIFAFLTDNLQQYYGNCYMLQVSNTSIHMYKCNRNGNQQSLGSASVQQFANTAKGKAKLNIMVDRENKAIVLMVNDTVVKQFPASAGFSGLGKGILFQPQTQGNFKVSRIRISSWGGKLPSEAGVSAGEGGDDTIKFVNGDKVTGSLLSIADGTAQFKTSYATLTIPVQRVVAVDLSPDNMERARRNKSDVKASFASGGTVTVQLTSIENSKLKGSSENFGMVTMPVAAFKSLEFNVYREKEEEEGDDFDL